MSRSPQNETATALTAPHVELDHLRSEQDAIAFRELNEEWITRSFYLEAKDRETLGNPRGSILAKGGCVLMARLDGKPVGCVALIPMGGGDFELSKMAVDANLRGLGVGRKLILYAIEEARNLGATRLLLGSSTKLPNAVHLYESVAFQHVASESLPEMKYSRADVFMARSLTE